jgi:shikimate kinase
MQREKYYLQAHHVLDVSLMDNYEKIRITTQKVRELLNRK